MSMTWEEWKSSRAEKRAVLRKYGLGAPSRRSVSLNTAERAMLKAFNGRRIPAWAGKCEEVVR